MTKQEREYLVLRLAQDLAKLLRVEPGQQVAFVELVAETLAAIRVYLTRYVLSKQERK